MHSFAKYRNPVIMLLALVLGGGLFYGLGLWGCKGGDRMAVLPHEEVRARGRLKLIAKARDFSREEWPRRLGELLERANVAPVARLRVNFLAPDQITAQVPPQGLSTPTPPPTGLFVAGGELAAGVSCPKALSYPPCILIIKHSSGGSERRIERRLVEGFDLHWAELVIYGNGEGLLVFISGWLPGGEWYTAIYIAEAPGWELRLLLDNEGTGADQYTVGIGATVDGGTVYLSNFYGNGGLWRVDTKSHSIQVISRDPSVRGHYLLPSPDAAFVCVGWTPHLLAPGLLTQRPLQLVDCRDGSTHTLTWRSYGSYVDAIMAWSADVPGRLYFIDLLDNLWQLDIDLSQDAPESVEQR